MGNTNDEALAQLRRSLRHNVIRMRLTVVAFALCWLASVAWLVSRAPEIPAVLSVERLEILEPDGAPAMVLANSQRPVAATIDGQQLMSGQEEERRVPSIIFFDGKGDEVGGMLFGREETPEGYKAVRHLSLDGYGQDQTVVLAHYQDQDGSTSGLMVNDVPQHSLLDTYSELGLSPGASREQMTAAIDSIPEDGRETRLRELFGTRRAFFGSARSGDARLALRDGQGRVRFILEAPRDGEPSMRFLNEAGETVLRLPQ